MISRKKIILSIFVAITFSFIILIVKTLNDIKHVPQSFGAVLSSASEFQIVDRHGKPLNITYQNRWNVHEVTELHEIPMFLKTAFIHSEDKRFFKHGGADWWARASALFVNIKKMRAVRGASTITEQVVRMINRRPRTVWSRWIEGWEAGSLEQYYDKNEIFEFYLNQVPYAANRRGIVQAARFYFDRDLDTLSKKEMLALVVLVRAPSKMDLHRDSNKDIQSSILGLSGRLVQKGVLSEIESTILLDQKFEIQKSSLDVSAPHFIEYVRLHTALNNSKTNKVFTTLDSSFQKRIQFLTDKHLVNHKSKKVLNAAALVADHATGGVLAWVVGGNQDKDKPGSFINAVKTPRQPGSALKPFLYALALEKGWSPATIIDDSPLTESVGNGLHSYSNYSHTFYGPVTVRQALANSLNIPALKTLQYVGSEEYLRTLHNIGFSNINNHPNYYGDGISLGNAEVSLFELVQAFSTIANKGIFKPLNVFNETSTDQNSQMIFSKETASLIANILSDDQARTLEFGPSSVLNIPIQTAVKTGTSSDYRDAWAVGFNYNHTVGVWMGNLDQTPTEGVTGSTGPALLLRSIFSELTKNADTKPLYLSPKLVREDFCINSEQLLIEDEECITQTEWFTKGTEPQKVTEKKEEIPIRIQVPSNNLHIAFDPRIPKDSQAVEFYIKGVENTDVILWNINKEAVKDKGSKHLWYIEKGKHYLSASVIRGGKQITQTPEINFWVK
jgi:penicillin-binding protein 1C